MKKDKSEKNIFLRHKFRMVDKIIDAEFGMNKLKVGMCHKIWARKKFLLKSLYNIDWKTPAELNPDIRFD